MTYSMTCTCGQTLTVDAGNDAEAETKMLAVGKIHGRDVHPNEDIPDDAILQNIRTYMKKEGG